MSPRVRRMVGLAATLAALAAAAAVVAPLTSAAPPPAALTHSAHQTTPASISGLIAFQREQPAGDHTQTDIDTVQPDGSHLARLTATPGRNEFGPAWSPDGSRLAFWRTRAPFGPGSLWVMDANGDAARALTTGVDARDPSWDPTGTRLVYDRASADLYTLRVADGLGRTRLTSGPPLDFEPAWSPDGTRIAFTRGSQTGDPGNIDVLTLATHVIRQLTHTPAYDHQVAWAPAGHRLVFERDWAGSSSIFTMKSDGSDLRRLSSGPHFDVGPVYSPDASFIAFGSDRADTMDNLWIMRSDGSDAHPTLSLPFSESFPDWH